VVELKIREGHVGGSDRADLILALEAARKSRVVAYMTSDRQPPFKALIAGDVVRPFFEHMQGIGEVRKLDILVFSLGGETIVPWRLVNLAREYCDRLGVLVPYKAHSAATLLALGADEIVMGPLGELSPIDPSIGGPFNPPHPDVPNEQKQEVGVEDVAGFLNLAKERVGLSEQDALVRVFEKLAERLHPLALGGVYRSHALIRVLATKMLALHMRKKADQQRIPQIVDDLAERLYYHGYLIGRHEAEELGLKVTRPNTELERLMWALFQSYERAMGLGSPFDPASFLAESGGKEQEVPVAIVESRDLVSTVCKKIQVSQVSHQPQPGSGQVPQFVLRERASGWVTSRREGS
jgi:hypothetical protein